MKNPIGIDEHTSSTRLQPEESTREVLAYIWLLEYDFRCRKQQTSELIRELGGDRGYKSRVAHTKRIVKEAQEALRRSENHQGAPMCHSTDRKAARQKLGRQKIA